MLELPALDQFADEAASDGVRVLSIVVKGEPSGVRRLTADSRVTTVADPLGKVADWYHVPLQPYTVVISGSAVVAQFAGAAKQVRLLDALRAATKRQGGAVVARAGSDWRRRPAELARKNGRFFDGKRAVARVNEGRWVAQPDGAYIDPGSQRVFALATVRGRSAEAFALAEIHARRALGLAAEDICSRATPPRRAGPETGMRVVLAGQFSCVCSAHETFAHLEASTGTVRVAFFWAGKVVAWAAAEHPNGTASFTGKAGAAADLMPAIRQKLVSEGRLLADPLEPASSPDADAAR